MIVEFHKCGSLSGEYVKCLSAGQVQIAPFLYSEKTERVCVVGVFWGHCSKRPELRLHGGVP